jgi:protein-tyrosine phosphatase
MGISRSTTIVIYYLMKKNNIKFEVAYNMVKEKRKVTKPNYGFVKQLQQVEIY